MRNTTLPFADARSMTDISAMRRPRAFGARSGRRRMQVSEKGLYRKLQKNLCIGCDHPAWCPSKKINPKNACKRCMKVNTKREKRKWEQEDE